MSSTSDLRLDWCSHQAAAFAVKRWHYSHSLPPPPHNRIGVWEGQRFVGCVLFARGASPALLAPYGLTAIEGCELVRVALDTHKTPVSRIVAIAIKFLKRRCPGLRLIVSFADPSEGHHGGIYQAMGWIYVGQTAPAREYIGPDGKRWHGRMVSGRGVAKVFGQKRRVLTPSQCKPFIRRGKYRYLYPLDDAMRGRVAPLGKPYPKRERSREIAAPLPSGEGGEIPTRSLHKSRAS